MPGSWPRAPKTLGITCVSCMLTRWRPMGVGGLWELGRVLFIRKSKSLERVGTFSVSPGLLGKRGWRLSLITSSQWFSQLCPRNEVMKPPLNLLSDGELAGWRTHQGSGREACLERAWRLRTLLGLWISSTWLSWALFFTVNHSRDFPGAPVVRMLTACPGEFDPWLRN